MKIITLFPALSLISSLALAQISAQPLSDAEKHEKLTRAETLKSQAAKMESAADDKLEAENAACYKKFLVNSCLEQAKETHRKAIREAKRLELEGGEIERDVKRREVAIKDAERETKARERATEQQRHGEQYRAEEQSKADERAAKAAKKEQKAAENRRKHAEEQARHQAKMEKRARKDAELAEKRRAREAREAAKNSGAANP
ncbi:MAG: hypothetical protein H6943_00165 [Zoogloeaceae bacterium]|nr:hypothetical protein [Zoogloeaceae bacterium]